MRSSGHCSRAKVHAQNIVRNKCRCTRKAIPGFYLFSSVVPLLTQRGEITVQTEGKLNNDTEKLMELTLVENWLKCIKININLASAPESNHIKRALKTLHRLKVAQIT